jgi:hypothetical protein
MPTASTLKRVRRDIGVEILQRCSSDTNCDTAERGLRSGLISKHLDVYGGGRLATYNIGPTVALSRSDDYTHQSDYVG